MEPIKKAAKRAADLLNTEEMSGWKLAELTADRTLTTSAPKKVRQERAEGRVSSAEWAQAVSGAWGRSWSEGTARTYARAWRRFGADRLADPNGCERSFYEHITAAGTTASGAEERIEDAAQRRGAVRAAPTPAEVVEAVRKDPDVARALARHDDTREAIEEFGIEARAERTAEIDDTYAGRLRKIKDASAARARRMDDDLALGELRQAVDALGAAIVMKEQYGVTNVDEEAELVAKVGRLLAAYTSGTLNDTDHEWLETMGIQP